MRKFQLRGDCSRSLRSLACKKVVGSRRLRGYNGNLGGGTLGGDAGVSQNWGHHFAGPKNKDYSLLGSIMGSPYPGKLLCGGVHRARTWLHERLRIGEEGTCTLGSPRRDGLRSGGSSSCLI